MSNKINQLQMSKSLYKNFLVEFTPVNINYSILI